MASKGYLRTNYRQRVGAIVLVYHSDSTAGYLTGLPIPTGLMALTGLASVPEILVYRGDAFVVYTMVGSTGA